MRVAVLLQKFYDWIPVPPNVVVTDAEVAAGKVMPGREPGQYRMKVVREPPGGTTREIHITEAALIEKIIEEKSDHRRGGHTLDRQQAMARLVEEHGLRGEAEAEWITGFVVHDDGPSEELLRAKLAPHTQAEHGRRPGRMNVPPEHVEAHVAAYMTAYSPESHAVHLNAHFGVGS